MTDFFSLSDADLLAQYKAAKGTSNPADFAEAYGPAAAKAAAKLNVDPQVLLGQWGLETGWGKSIIPGTNNLGNIKDFSGGGTAATDNMTGSRDKYRAYASPDAFADDYTDLIARKYPGAVGAKTPEQFAAALKAGGYAEDPNYAAKVVKASQMAQPKGVVQRAVEAVIPSANAAEAPNYGNRPDGSAKGSGYFGELKRPDGNISTELSVGVNIGGKEMDIPLLVPTMTKAEIDQALSLPTDQQPPEALVRKAAMYAKQRIAQGKGVFAGSGDQVSLPTADKGAFDGMSDADLMAAYQKAKGTPAAAAAKNDSGAAASLGKGFASGFADVGNTIINSGTKAGADALAGISDPNGLIPANLKRSPAGAPSAAEQQNAARGQALQGFNDENANGFFNGGRILGNVAATYPVGGAIAAPLKAVAPAGSVLARLASAVGSGGATTGAPAAAGVAPAAGNMLLRMAGGATTGAASAGLIDPNAATTGAVVGAALPPALAGVKAVANTAGALVRPFTGGGQNKIVGDTLREFATDPVAARAAMQNTAAVVPGSAPTAATASGDAGIAALSRSMQNASPDFAADMAARQTAQNQARTAALEGVAGNTGKIDLAKAARDASTGPMREAVLDAAGAVPSDGIIKSIDRLLTNPNNAGELSQQALNKFRNRIADLSSNGAIDARALYEVRKDINTMLSGKLQGEAGNLRYASGQLGNVKGLIDDAIDQASRRVSSGPVPGAPLSASREVVPFVASTELGAPASTAVGQALPQGAQSAAANGARPTWRGYLQSYADQSVPIRQMEKLDDILKSVQTGTVDTQGGAILSAAKLNNLLKNQGSDLVKDLSPQQLQILRSIQADLNAGQIASNVGRAVGSNTVQNLAQNQLLQSALGKTLGGSTAASSTLGRLLQLPYGAANKQIQERLGNALLNPQDAAKLLADPKNNALLQALTQNGLPYKAVPAISAR